MTSKFFRLNVIEVGVSMTPMFARLTFREKLVALGAGWGLERSTHNPAITSMVFPLLQKSTNICVGNIENDDGAGCGVERKLVHPRGRGCTSFRERETTSEENKIKKWPTSEREPVQS